MQIDDAVEFFGFVSRHADVLSTMASASVFVSASEIEGFGIALVEAMALGTPYVVASIPAFEEVTGGGVGGALFSNGDEKALAQHLERLLADIELRRRLGADGEAHARQYTWERVAASTAEVLRATVQRSRPRGSRSGWRRVTVE